MIQNKCGIKTSPDSPGIPQAKSIIEKIYQVLVNIARTYNLHKTYVDDTDPWMGILAQQLLRYDLRATVLKKHYRPIIFLLIHYPPNKSHSKLEIYISA